MSNELRIGSGSGNVVYAHIISPSARRWNGSAFEVYASGSYPNYTITMTEQGTSGVYVGDFPATIATAALYEVWYYLADSVTPTEGDHVAGEGSVNWSGSSVIPSSAPISGELSASDWVDYIVRTFRRTDKTTDIYDATNEAIGEIRRTFATAREEKETALTQQISVLGQYKMDVETDLGLNVSDVFIQDTSNGRYLIPISKSMFDWLYTRWGTSAAHRAKPIHYCLYARQILIGPAPNTIAYNYVVSYSKDDHILVDVTTSSVPFTTTDYREILKHGVLMRIFSLVENDEQAQKYGAFWLKGLKEIETKEDRNRRAVIATGYIDF